MKNIKKVEPAVIETAAPAAVIETAAPAPAPAFAIVDGITVKMEALAKLEKDWKSAEGRIRSAVDKAAGVSDEFEFGDSARSAKRDKRSGILSGKDGTRRQVGLVLPTVSAVDKASKELETLGFLGSRDADLWRSYVRLALALEALESIGRLA